VSVIICTFNRASLLERTLGALARQNFAPKAFEVLVVDDGSEDETREVCQRMRPALPNLRYMALGANRGKAKALNTGVGQAEGEHILFTDDDCIPGEHWVEHMSAGLKRVPIVAGAIDIPTKPYLKLCQNISALHAYLSGQRAGPTEMVTGANAGFRRSVLEGLDGFQSSAEPAEDTEYVLRAREKGYPVEFLPEAVVTHDPLALTLGGMVRYAADHASKTILLRNRYRRLLGTPYVLRSPSLLLAASPLIALKVTLGIYFSSTRMVNFLWTAPVVYVLKVAWCWGAARGLRGALQVEGASDHGET
jgi:GT2 family glycosyltransferase